MKINFDSLDSRGISPEYMGGTEGRDIAMDAKSLSQALVVCTLAMGQVLGEGRLAEVRRQLRNLIEDGGIERGTARILKSIIAGIEA